MRTSGEGGHNHQAVVGAGSPGELMVAPVTSRAGFERAAEILDEAAAWAAAGGFRSWEPGAFGTPGTIERRALLSALHSGDLYLVRDGGRAVATVSLLWEDRLYWPAAPDDGAYVHRLAVLRSAGGRGVGRALLGWAEDIARVRGRRYLRLDCVSDDEPLRRYYERAGFCHRGDLKVRGTDMSLYEKTISLSGPSGVPTPSPGDRSPPAR
jgi:ribosomal protein S18 acetylase RimI-like enzyme